MTHADVVFGYLAYQYPCHIALSCSWIPMLDSLCDTGAMLLELAEAVHQLISFLPSTLILQLEREELLWDRKGWSNKDFIWEGLFISLFVIILYH